MRLFSLLISPVLIFACASPEEPVEKDPTDPILAISSPERGTASAEAVMIVTGTATDADSGIETVTVNGVVAVLDGSAFRAEVTLTPGTNAIETVARDKSGNESTDIRSALHGEFAAPGPVENAVAVRLGREALSTIGDTASSAILATDFGPTLTTVNPVLDTGGSCLGAEADLTSVDFESVSIELVPSTQELTINAEISDLAVGVHLDYDIACIGGRRDIVSTAELVELTVSLEAAVSGGQIVFDTTEAQVRLTNVDLGIGGLPTALIELIIGNIETKIGDALSTLLASELEPQLESAFESLTEARTVSLLGEDISIAVVPQALALTDAGISLTTSSDVAVVGGTGTGYVPSPRSVPSMNSEFGIAIADDAVGQAFGALWAAGALAREIPLSGDSGADLGGGIADSVEIDALLPPIIDFDNAGGAQLEIADLIVRLHRDGESVTELAVSATLEINLGSGPTGVVMMASEPTLLLQRLTPDGFLTENDLGILEAFLANYLQGDLSALIGEIPLPSFAGTSVGGVESQTGAGYLTMDIDITAESTP